MAEDMLKHTIKGIAPRAVASDFRARGSGAIANSLAPADLFGGDVCALFHDGTSHEGDHEGEEDASDGEYPEAVEVG